MSTRGLRRRGRAFSLIELVLVVAILAVLAAVVLPRYAGSVARYRVASAAQRVARDLDQARQRARSLGASQTVVFDLQAGTCQIAGLQALDGGQGGYTTDLSAAPFHARLDAAAFGGDSTVVFNGFGIPDSPGSVTIRVGDLTRTVTLDAQTGRTCTQ